MWQICALSILPFCSPQLFRRCSIAEIAEAAKIKVISTILKTHIQLKATKCKTKSGCGKWFLFAFLHRGWLLLIQHYPQGGPQLSERIFQNDMRMSFPRKFGGMFHCWARINHSGVWEVFELFISAIASFYLAPFPGISSNPSLSVWKGEFFPRYSQTFCILHVHPTLKSEAGRIKSQKFGLTSKLSILMKSGEMRGNCLQSSANVWQVNQTLDKFSWKSAL